ncbi:MAG: 4Fe-4S dicluster domain-containing protein [Lentimicrobium sp.]|nr:4Fe-4S dicluster domain-containing protein [Lentimicrobium sp.]
MKTSDIRLFSTVVAIALALPFGWRELTGLYAWFSPFIMFNSIFMLKTLAWLNALGFLIFIISFFRKRWFCHTLCPVGLGCDFFSGMSHRKHFSLHKVPLLGRWLALISFGAAFTGIPLFILLDPMAIFNGFFSLLFTPFSVVVFLSLLVLPLLLLIHVIFPGIWCMRLCPLGGILDEVANLRAIATRYKKRNIYRGQFINTERRLFIAGGIGMLAGLAIPQWLHQIPVNYFRPPSSAEPDVFNNLCIRCGNCIKACPTHIIIPHLDRNNITSWMTPEISFRNNGYCLEDCILCGSVCPSGAIRPFSVGKKRKLYIGRVKINMGKCLLTDYAECDRCKAVCHYNAIEIVPGDQPLVMTPSVDIIKCVGCGACVAVCPPGAINMIPL